MRKRVSFPKVAAATAAAVVLVIVACTTEPPAAADTQAMDAQSVSEARGEEVVAIQVDPDGMVRVNDLAVPLDRVADAVARYEPDAVVSLEVHESARYHVVAALQSQLQAAGLLRVVFTTVATEAQRGPRDVSVLLEDGLPTVLPDATMPGLEQVNIDPRNLLFLDVQQPGIVAVRLGADPRRQMATPDQIESVWENGVSRNSDLIAVVRTHPDAEYRAMYEVLDALHRAKAERISLQIAQ